jgi:hypothetical protein
VAAAPREVAKKIRAGGVQALGDRELLETPKLDVLLEHSAIPAYLANARNRGEAAVINAALAAVNED